LIDGDTTRLDPGVAADFRTTGMTHLTAVSGSNVAMIVGTVLFAARWTRRGPGVTAASCALALVGFVVLVRPSPSVLRAAAMGGLALIALATGRDRAAVPGLGAAVAALILYDPALATDVGFGLSTFATGGLLLIAPRWRDALRRRRVPAGLAEAIAVPAAAQIACSPLIAGFTGTVSLVAVPANLLAVPAVPAATILGVGAAVVSPVWPGAAAFLAWLASWPARWLIVVARIGAGAPDAVARWPAGIGGAVLLAALLAGALLAARRRPARLVAAVVLVGSLLGAAPVRIAAIGWPPRDALLVACDVGQGDGLVLPLGSGRAVVVDSGPEPTAIDGCLRRLGVHDVALLILTHFHADHVGGIDGVYDGRRVTAIMTSPFPEPAEGYRAVLTAAAEHRTPVSTPNFGEVISLGPVRLTVLGPVARLVGTRSDPNDNSLVIRVDDAAVRILLTGDAEIEEQAEVLATAGPAALRADVLKVPHHGSAYQDPAFLAAVAPTLALVSVAAVNPYGLPSQVTLDRLARSGARVMLTDVSGDVATVDVHGRLGVTARGHPATSPAR
jgi:competence protein ComEC